MPLKLLNQIEKVVFTRIYSQTDMKKEKELQ